MDASLLLKDFSLLESFNLQLRTEARNVLNHPNWADTAGRKLLPSVLVMYGPSRSGKNRDWSRSINAGSHYFFMMR